MIRDTTLEWDADELDVEVTDLSHIRHDDWHFAMRMTVRYSHPKFETLTVEKKFQADPTRNDVTSRPDQVHIDENYYVDGDLIYQPRGTEVEFHHDIDDHDGLENEIREEYPIDPTAEIDGLLYSNLSGRRLEKLLRD